MNSRFIIFHIYKFNRCFESIILEASDYNKTKNMEICDSHEVKFPKKFETIFYVDGYFLSVFVRTLEMSQAYSNMVIDYISNLTKYVSYVSINIKLQLVKPKLEVLDYAWNDRISNLVAERLELDNAMSWLSTLGGAFSALGDDFENCARVAGKISIQQFKIAFRLGEPSLVARCQLYMALSLIQLRKLPMAKVMVLKQYEVAKNTKDIRLQNMCKGIWAKLQFIYKKKRQEPRNIIIK